MTKEIFEHKVWPIRDKLFRFARRLMQFPDVAEDVTQDVLTKIWTERQKLDEVRNVEAYAMTITRNKCLDRLKAKNRFHEELGDKHQAEPALVQDQDPGKREMFNFVREMINEMPEPNRTVIHLRDEQGYSFEEISKITGLTESNIRVILSRTRKKIRDEINKLYSYGIKGDI